MSNTFNTSETLLISKKEQTPLMRQYYEIKAKCPNDILLFRMGDFYELFGDDAVQAAPIIGLTLTCRNKKSGDTTPMCGFPHHSMAGPIQKLLAAGLRVAICDQMSTPTAGGGLVTRQITRKLSPAMVYDPDTLDQKSGHYLMSFDDNHIAFLDASTAEAFYYSNDKDFEYFFEAFNIVEILLQNETQVLQPPQMICVTYLEPSEDPKNTSYKLKDCRDVLLNYVSSNQGDNFKKSFDTFKYMERSKTLHLSSKVFKHLEIFKSYEGDTKGTLFDTINKTTTPSGARRLKHWLRNPLCDRTEISRRQDEIAIWTKDFVKLKKMRELLKSLGDLERRTLKITSPSAGPRDLLRLSDSLEVLKGLTSFVSLGKDFNGPKWNEENTVSALQDVDKLDLKQTDLDIETQVNNNSVYNSIDLIHKLITHAIKEDAPAQFANGQFMQSGFNPELDEVINLADNAQGLIQQMEIQERENTGVQSLKIRYNSVFGYYIEVSKVHTHKIPSHYIRKQTLVSSERYTTEELQTLEEKVLLSKTKRIELELAALAQIKEQVLTKSKDFLQVCHKVAEVDVLSSLAWLSIERKYVRAELSLNGDLHLKKSRHPVVEVSMPQFIPNDIDLEQGQCLLITGPNMAGKSTVMRQVALSVILNQMGSFVPASSAVIPIYQTLHTRIGASDFLSQGLSTFMVEMSETAELLHQAGPNSLIILDEIGRGTSTYDGLSLAQAILEELLAKQASFLFSTHYQELTQIAAKNSKVLNRSMGVKKTKDRIFFEYVFKTGAAEKSYGIEVARIAGLKEHVLSRATDLLQGYESSPKASLSVNSPNSFRAEGITADALSGLPPQVLNADALIGLPPQVLNADALSGSASPDLKTEISRSYQLSFLEEEPKPIVDPKILEVIKKVKAFATNEATPLQALNEISKWQKNL